MELLRSVNNLHNTATLILEKKQLGRHSPSRDCPLDCETTVVFWLLIVVPQQLFISTTAGGGFCFCFSKQHWGVGTRTEQFPWHPMDHSPQSLKWKGDRIIWGMPEINCDNFSPQATWLIEHIEKTFSPFPHTGTNICHRTAIFFSQPARLPRRLWSSYHIPCIPCGTQWGLLLSKQT